ncbi:MAG: RNA 2',3'-cyclic phosphodiesterase [Bacteroidales bacterium]
MRRTFIGIKINPGDEFLNTYTKLRNELENEKIKWVDTDKFHLTLFFLGDTEEDKIEEIRLKLSNIVDEFDKFTLDLKGLGVFRDFVKPKVLWGGIYNYETLASLKNIVDKEMVKSGFTPDKRKFTPHLTIGRIKFLKNRETLKKLVLEHKHKYFDQIKINELIYYESILRPQGPQYIPIEKYVL